MLIRTKKLSKTVLCVIRLNLNCSNSIIAKHLKPTTITSHIESYSQAHNISQWSRVAYIQFIQLIKIHYWSISSYIHTTICMLAIAYVFLITVTDNLLTSIESHNMRYERADGRVNTSKYKSFNINHWKRNCLHARSIE